MIDKKISLGTIITIATIIGTFIYTQGIMDTKVSTFEEDTSNNRKKIMSNREKIHDVEVNVAGIEAKIDEGFKRLETLLIEN
tara:strand:+ start:502 stop:747 length:246 start_codon:yes stop_codon:yes gene_type:complete